MRNYQNYAVWQKAHELCVFIYKKVLCHFPPEEKFGLASQLRRAVSSIPMNIAEGCGRGSEKDFVHFLDIALGSIHEVEYCLLLTSDLGFITKEMYNITVKQITDIKAMLIGLIKSIRKPEVKPKA